MLIVSQDKRHVVNLDNVRELYIEYCGSRGGNVIADMDGVRLILGRYPSGDAAEFALADITAVYSLENHVHFMPRHIDYDGQDREPPKETEDN